jgi:hypothetical protein
VLRGTGFELVSESGAVVQDYGCGTATCQQRSVAVSPDGKRVAYWRTGQTPQWELRVFDVATPTAVRTVATLPSSQRGGALAWSSDSQGVAFGVQSVETLPAAGGGPKSAGVSSIDLTAPQAPLADALPMRTDGSFYVPVAWDRAKKLFAAVVTGEGGFVLEYDTADASGFKPTRVPAANQMVANQVEASPDATRVLGIDINMNLVRVWPVTNIGAAVEVRPGSGARITGAHWRTANEVGWTFGSRFDVFVPQTATSRTVLAGPSELRLMAFRADGTAALVAQQSGAEIVDVQSGATNPSTLPATTPIVPRGILLR